MTQKEIVRKIAIRTNYDMFRIDQIIYYLFDEVQKAMKNEKPVRIKSFGTFYTKRKKYKNLSGEGTAINCKIKYSMVLKNKVKNKYKKTPKKLRTVSTGET